MLAASYRTNDRPRLSHSSDRRATPDFRCEIGGPAIPTKFLSQNSLAKVRVLRPTFATSHGSGSGCHVERGAAGIASRISAEMKTNAPPMMQKICRQISEGTASLVTPWTSAYPATAAGAAKTSVNRRAV